MMKVWKGYMKGLQHRSKDVTLTASGEHVHASDNLFVCICEKARERILKMPPK